MQSPEHTLTGTTLHIQRHHDTMYPPSVGVNSAQQSTTSSSSRHAHWLQQLVSEAPCRSRQSYAILGASLASIAAYSLAATLLHSHPPLPGHVPPLPSLSVNDAVHDPAYLENLIAYDLNYGIAKAAVVAALNEQGAGNPPHVRIGLLHMAALDQLAAGIGSLLVSAVMGLLWRDCSPKRIHDAAPASSDVGIVAAGGTLRRVATFFRSTMADAGLPDDVNTALPLLLMSPHYALYSTAVGLALSALVIIPDASSTSQLPQIALVPILAVRVLCSITPLIVPGLSLSLPLVATMGLASVSWISSLASVAAQAVDVATVCTYTAVALAGVGLAGRAARDMLVRPSILARDRPSVSAAAGGRGSGWLGMFVRGVQSLIALVLLLVLSALTSTSTSASSTDTKETNGFSSNQLPSAAGFLVFATAAHILTQYATLGASLAPPHQRLDSTTVSLDPTVHSSLLASSTAVIPPAAVEPLRDAGAILVAGTVFGIADVSPFVLKAAYFGTCAAVVYALVKARASVEHVLIHSATSSKGDKITGNAAGSHKSVLVLAAMTLSLALILASPTNHRPPAPPTTSSSSTSSSENKSPSASRRQWSSWDPATPLNYDLTLHIDPSLPSPSKVGQKAAKVFAVDSDSVTTPSTDRTRISATLPALATWPRRKWDRQPVTRHANFSLRHHVRFGATGVPTALHRYIVMHQTFADPHAHPDVHLRMYWSHADDPRGLHGVQSYLMHAYMNATGSTSYPVILGGDWKLLAFNMLVHMYETSPGDVAWFALGAEGTVWFPRQVQALVTSLDVDPLQTYVYMGEVSENKGRQRTHGNMASAGGGMLISRALARMIHKHHAFCVQHLTNKDDRDFFGADLIKACVDAVAVKDGIRAGVPLTRVPMFNPLELAGLGWPSGRAYLSARLSRAPPVSANDLEALPPLFSSGVLTRMLAVHDWWHLVEQMPRALMFRRFFVHVRGRDVGKEATVVVTFGLHVRVYERIVPDVDHHVDFDGEISKDAEMWGADWLTESAQVSATNKWTWPNEETSITDFWIHEYDERDGGLMVYVEEGNRAKFGIRAKCDAAGGAGNVLTLCSVPEVVDGWVQ